VDTNRNLIVLQDSTGAVALNWGMEDATLQVGRLVTLEGTNCCPAFVSFPDYPYRPSGCDICSSFETPMNWGEYNFTRMRGYLHPQVTGDYTFWIASDNSSELWLSTDEMPSMVRKIASIPRFGYVDPHEWSRYPSQHSEAIPLQAGETYYIEAVQEQTTVQENLSVAWQGPGLGRAVVAGQYLTPWNGDDRFGNATNGILRQYWTNYPAGNVEGMVGARPFESSLSVEKVLVHIRGMGEMPKPEPMVLNQPLPVEKNYRWVQAEGVLKFKAKDGNTASLELSVGSVLTQVRALRFGQEMERQLTQFTNMVVRVVGVCEGVHNEQGTIMPGLIWGSAENSVSFIAPAPTNADILSMVQTIPATVTTDPSIQGYFATRGVVTFNDRVFDKDYIFVQADDSSVMVSPENQCLKTQLNVEKEVDLGGKLEAGKFLPIITPLVVTELGWRSMPMPIAPQPGIPFPPNSEGKWSELEGVAHSVDSNGTLSIIGKNGRVYFWLGQTPSNRLAGYVDAKLRARGVLMVSMLDAPVLLVPSRDFVEVEAEPPKDPFGMRRQLIADLLAEGTESSCSQRVRVTGEVTYRDTESFFIQDASGGIRVRTGHEPAVNVGESLEVIGFKAQTDFGHILTEPMIRPVNLSEHVKATNLDFNEALSFTKNGTLVHVKALLLAQITNEMGQVLELQEQQRVFIAALTPGQGRLPGLVPGSRLRVTGICDDEANVSPLLGEKPPAAQIPVSLKILLRTPQDVMVLSGPPWWNWKKAVTLVGILLTILVVSLLWVQLLHRRLERQHAAQLAFTRQVLERLEDERRRIAVNLHDSLGQTLMVIKNYAIMAIQRPPDGEGLRHHLDEISGATSQAIDEVRRITHGLRPYQLDRLGLTQAIRASVNLASENKSIVFASRVEDIDGMFDKDAEIHVYRIVQEAITNVVKHAAATEAAVVIKKRPETISISIRDNGRGFDPANSSSHSHDLGYGLDGIAERVRILAGTLVIHSRPGEGTSLTVEVPLTITQT
jgi:signal transduction histidine kinase